MDIKKRLESSRKDRVKKLLEKINSGEYEKEYKEDINRTVSGAYEDLSDEDREKLIEKERQRMKKRYDEGK